MEKEPKTIEVDLSTAITESSSLPRVLRTTPVKAIPVSNSEINAPNAPNAPRVLSISPPRMQLYGDNRFTESFNKMQYKPLTRGSPLFYMQPNSLGSFLINADVQYLNTKKLLQNILGNNNTRIKPHPQIEELNENSNANQTQINTSQTQLPEQNIELRPFSCASLVQSPEQPKTFILSFMGYTAELNADRMSLSALSSVDFKNLNISKESERLLRDIFESNLKPHPRIEELDENSNADQTKTNNSQNIELQPFSCFSLINHPQSEAYISTSKGQTLELKSDQSESLADKSILLNRQKQTRESQTQTRESQTQTRESQTQTRESQTQTRESQTQTEQSFEQATQNTQTENYIGQASKATQTEHIKQTIQTKQTIQHTAGVSARFVYPDNLNLTPGPTVTNPIGENTVQRQGCFSSCAIS
jgi:hypothetical protein